VSAVLQLLEVIELQRAQKVLQVVLRTRPVEVAQLVELVGQFVQVVPVFDEKLDPLEDVGHEQAGQHFEVLRRLVVLHGVQNLSVEFRGFDVLLDLVAQMRQNVHDFSQVGVEDLDFFDDLVLERVVLL